jgi:hypothetical protein
LKYTDPTGHFFGIGGKIKREARRFERRVSRHADEITGVVMMVAGAIMIATEVGAPYGAGLMSTGAGLIKGEYHIFNGDINIEYNVSYTTSLGGNSGGLTSSQQNIIAQGRALDARDSMRATTTSSGSAYIDVSGIDYVYGEDSDPYGDVYVGEVSISYMTPTDEMILAQVLSTDVADLAYTAFTFTNVGAVYDTISQYSNGDISTTELLLQGGTGLLLGGTGAKAVKGLRIHGSWSINDLKQGLLGYTPKGLGKPDLHHRGQMPGSGIDEYLPSFHRGNSNLHPNRYNQGVTREMRQSDRQLHWWYRAREQGADNILPEWIYD